MQRKFILACLGQVSNKEELDEIYKLSNIENEITNEKELFAFKRDLLKEAMGEAIYFDISNDAEQAYYQFEAMFLSFHWKHANNIDILKKLVAEL